MVSKTEQVYFDKTGLTWLLFILFLPVLGFWEAWQWYFNRIASSAEEAIGLLAFLMLVLYFSIGAVKERKTLYKISLWPLVFSLLIYSLCCILGVPPIFRAGIAFLVISFVIYCSSFGRLPPASFWALVLISLPVVPSLQFYLGYPARYLSAFLTVPLLNLNGIAVIQSGTNLLWQGQLLQFDAPCSGVTMLWSGLFLALFMSFIYRFNFVNTLMAMGIASVLVLLGNILRASSLFYLEIGAISFQPPWFHEGIGVASFLLILLGVVLALSKFQRWVVTP